MLAGYPQRVVGVPVAYLESTCSVLRAHPQRVRKVTAVSGDHQQRVRRVLAARLEGTAVHVLRVFAACLEGTHSVSEGYPKQFPQRVPRSPPTCSRGLHGLLPSMQRVSGLSETKSPKGNER